MTTTLTPRRALRTVLAAAVLATVTVGASAAYLNGQVATGFGAATASATRDEGTPRDWLASRLGEQGTPRDWVASNHHVGQEGTPRDVVAAYQHRRDEGTPSDLVA